MSINLSFPESLPTVTYFRSSGLPYSPQTADTNYSPVIMNSYCYCSRKGKEFSPPLTYSHILIEQSLLIDTTLFKDLLYKILVMLAV